MRGIGVQVTHAMIQASRRLVKVWVRESPANRALLPWAQSDTALLAGLAPRDDHASAARLLAGWRENDQGLGGC